MKSNDSNDQKLSYYLFPVIKKYLKNNELNIENEIQQIFKVNIQLFENRIKQGENDSQICTLIRQDLIEDFIKYVNKTNLSLCSSAKEAEISPSATTMGRHTFEMCELL